MNGILTLLLFLGTCFAMHFFMHGRHGHGDRQEHGVRTSEPDGDTADGQQSGKPRKHAGHGGY